MVQVTTVAQAIEAAERGTDVIIAQGGESGGYGGSISTMTLVPQVVDAVSPIPVVAAGGIFDGRGLAAALMLGASGVNLGTRFLASTEATIEEEWSRPSLEPDPRMR
jgi:nitronate monooxygenase/enoyl-[acyl-carrier protein] reductase II